VGILGWAERVAPTIGRLCLVIVLALNGRMSVRRRRLRQCRLASHGCAAPTFGRGKSTSIATHDRPKVGATRGFP
jgi:hypothetical protein